MLYSVLSCFYLRAASYPRCLWDSVVMLFRLLLHHIFWTFLVFDGIVRSYFSYLFWCTSLNWRQPVIFSYDSVTISREVDHKVIMMLLWLPTYELTLIKIHTFNYIHLNIYICVYIVIYTFNYIQLIIYLTFCKKNNLFSGLKHFRHLSLCNYCIAIIILKLKFYREVVAFLSIISIKFYH